MAKAGKILTLIAFSLVWSCSTKYSEVAPPTELTLTILNEAAKPLAGAIISLLTSQSDFDNLIAGTGTAIKTFLSDASGKVTFSISPELNNFYYISYHDSTLFAGNYITLDNSWGQYTLRKHPDQSSLSELTVILKPADGFVTIWTNNSGSFLPIDIFFGNKLVGTVNTTFAEPPNPFDAGALTIRARRGITSLEGKSPAGCLWSDQITVIVSKNVTYNLPYCNVGTIAFYTDISNATRLPINITLNANDQISPISAAVSAIPADCSAINLASAYRVPGTYTYEAVTADGKCSWIGTFIMNSNQCQLISLPTCN